MPGPEPNRPPSASPSDARPPAEPVLPDALRAAFQSASDIEGKFAALRQHFELKSIGDPANLQPGVLCALRKDDALYLVEIGPLKGDQRNVELRLHFSARPVKPAPISGLVELGRNGLLNRLEAKAPEKSPEEKPVLDPPEAATGPEATSTSRGESTNWAAQSLDLTSFTRLSSLAQSCGMVPNVDNIANVRDAEFRAGHYLAAFYNIERMYTALSTAAQQCQQQLRREETAHRSGRLNMSPREWQQKVARDTAKTQTIDRAMNQFRKVMAGLRSLALVTQQTGGPKEVDS
jgi:hypothetical protein